LEANPIGWQKCANTSAAWERSGITIGGRGVRRETETVESRSSEALDRGKDLFNPRGTNELKRGGEDL